MSTAHIQATLRLHLSVLLRIFHPVSYAIRALLDRQLITALTAGVHEIYKTIHNEMAWRASS